MVTYCFVNRPLRLAPEGNRDIFVCQEILNRLLVHPGPLYFQIVIGFLRLVKGQLELLHGKIIAIEQVLVSVLVEPGADGQGLPHDLADPLPAHAVTLADLLPGFSPETREQHIPVPLVGNALRELQGGGPAAADAVIPQGNLFPAQQVP